MMEEILTGPLLGALIKAGYCYFLGKFASGEDKDAEVEITLKPVKRHPLLHCLPSAYQRYYTVSQELLQMTKGLPHMRVMVELSEIQIDTFCRKETAREKPTLNLNSPPMDSDLFYLK